MPNRKPRQGKKGFFYFDLDKAVDSARSILEICRAEVEQKHLEQGVQQSQSDHKLKEAGRSTVRSACVAAEQRFSRSGGNPIHVWAAIKMCTNPDIAPMLLPAWCMAYLHEVANGLLAAEGDGDQLFAYVSRQLGFTRSGSSAVKDLASASRATRAALLYDKFRYENNTSSQAYEKVRSTEGFKETASARKLVKRGKAMLSYVPENTPLTRQSAIKSKPRG